MPHTFPKAKGNAFAAGGSGIDAILFDFMGVLLFPREGYRAEIIVDAVDDLIGGVVDDEAFRRTATRTLRIDAAEFERVLSHIPDKYEPLPPLWAMLPELRRRYRLGIINNGTRLTFPYFDARLKLTERFDLILSSGMEGVRKPDPEIYLRASQRLSIGPERCLFMDDSEANVRGAEQAGMRTVHWPDRDDGYRRFIDVLTTDGWKFNAG
jgi:HAD superfamily hydrolase (TIGR01509 family)